MIRQKRDAFNVSTKLNIVFFEDPIRFQGMEQ